MQSHARELSISDLMSWSHAHLDELYDDVLVAITSDAPEIRARWSELESQLLTHMEAEERYVLPAFARVDSVEAVALVREHGAIRERLLELGIALDLHCLHADDARELVRLLRAHAGREDNLLYRWADKRLDKSMIEAARRRLSTV